MKIVSWNANGIRSLENKGEFANLLNTENPDIIFIQETKSQCKDMDSFIEKYIDYDFCFCEAEKKGYSGTAVGVKKSLGFNYNISCSLLDVEDNDGRISKIEFNAYGKNFLIFGVYFPNGGKSNEAWIGKLKFYDNFLKKINEFRESGKTVIWCGDINCAHEEIDLKNPKSNKNSIGFLPEERAWVSKVIKNNWIDIFRFKNPEVVQYSWWSYRFKARERNIGWRIDYFFIDKVHLEIVDEMRYIDQQFGSDHCPLVLKLKFS